MNVEDKILGGWFARGELQRLVDEKQAEVEETQDKMLWTKTKPMTVTRRGDLLASGVGQVSYIGAPIATCVITVKHVDDQEREPKPEEAISVKEMVISALDRNCRDCRSWNGTTHTEHDCAHGAYGGMIAEPERGCEGWTARPVEEKKEDPYEVCRSPVVGADLFANLDRLVTQRLHHEALEDNARRWCRSQPRAEGWFAAEFELVERGETTWTEVARKHGRKES